MGLNEEISKYLEKVGPDMPAEIKTGLATALQKLRDQRITDQACRAGAQAPAFTLANHRGRLISSTVLLRSGPLVVSFYRGSW